MLEIPDLKINRRRKDDSNQATQTLRDLRHRRNPPILSEPPNCLQTVKEDEQMERSKEGSVERNGKEGSLKRESERLSAIFLCSVFFKKKKKWKFSFFKK